MPTLKCVSQDLLENITGFVKKKVKNESVASHFLGMLEDALPVCRGDKLIDIVQDGENSCPDTGGKAPKKTRKKRKPSAYNKFVGECQKNRPEGTKVTDQMRVCATEWKGMDDTTKGKYK